MVHIQMKIKSYLNYFIYIHAQRHSEIEIEWDL